MTMRRKDNRHTKLNFLHASELRCNTTVHCTLHGAALSQRCVVRRWGLKFRLHGTTHRDRFAAADDGHISAMLLSTALRCTALHCMALHRIALHRTALHCSNMGATHHTEAKLYTVV
jgi:hypothetical protein